MDAATVWIYAMPLGFCQLVCQLVQCHELSMILLVLLVPRRVRRQLEGGGVIEQAETYRSIMVLDRPGSERLVEARGATELKTTDARLAQRVASWLAWLHCATRETHHARKIGDPPNIPRR